MSHSQSKVKAIPPEVQKQIDALRAECERFDRKGLHDTAHHETLARILKEYGIENILPEEQ